MLARRYMRGEAVGHTLQTTAVVHEAYLRLVGGQPVNWQDRTHFFAVVATVMRRVLVDYARAQRADKRGGKLLVEWPSAEPSTMPAHTEDVLALDSALTRLAEMDARQCRIVELRYFAGLSVEETADALSISSRTVKREWRLARAWLLQQLNGV
jgi:RNA polymerase sigma-70 factor, ECF subfamily